MVPASKYDVTCDVCLLRAKFRGKISKAENKEKLEI